MGKDEKDDFWWRVSFPFASRRVLCITSVIPAKAGIQRGRATVRRT